jgi:hypothetical protein
MFVKKETQQKINQRANPEISLSLYPSYLHGQLLYLLASISIRKQMEKKLRPIELEIKMYFFTVLLTKMLIVAKRY